MNHCLRIVLLALFLVLPGMAMARNSTDATAHVPGAANATVQPEAQVTRLPNGLTVLVQEDDRFPLVSTRLYVHAGAAYERPEQAGISHLLEHMVFKSTEKRPQGRVAGDVEAVGGNVNAATSFDYTVYMADLPAEHWQLGLDVLKDMIWGARMDPQELAQEKKVVVAELERGEDSPGTRLFKSMQDMVWSGTPYERPIIGFRETLRDITRQDILDYIDRLYQPQSMLLVVVGNVDADAVLAQAEELFGGLSNDRVQDPPLAWGVSGPGAGPLVRVERGSWNKAYLSLAFPIPGFRAAEATGLEVLAHLLGGDKTSLLYRTFKYERRLVDDVSVSALTLERSGMLYVSANLSPDNVDRFQSELAELLAGLDADSFSDEELARARLNLEDSLYQAKETLSGLASKLGYFQFFEHTLRAEENFLHDLALVDRAQVGELADRYLRSDRLHLTALLPDEAAVDPEILAEAVSSRWPVPEAARQAQAEAADEPAAGEATTVDLGKGRTLVLLPDPTLPYTAMDIIFQGGDSLLVAEDQGLAELASRVLTKGTAELDATAMQEYLSARAARLSANANRDLFTVSAKFPSRFSKDMLGLVREVLTRSAFDPQEAEREQQNQIAAIASREDQPLGLAFRHVFPFLFQDDHHYAFYHQGHPERIEAFTPQEIRGYWERQRTRPWTMAVCGDFRREQVEALARDLAESLDGNDTAPDTGLPQWSEETTRTLHLSERNQTHLLAIFKAVPQGHEDTPGLTLLRSALAGQGGLLFRTLRDEQGLAYTVTAFLWQSPKVGFMAFYIGTYPEKADQALEGFQEIASTLGRRPLPKDEVERARNLLRGEYYRDHQTLSSRSREAASLLTQGFTLDYNRDVIERAQDLTTRDLQQLADTYLQWEDVYLLRVEP